MFTGAGVSTDSGIPDFRSPGGVWSKYQPVLYQDFCVSSQARSEYWRQKTELHAEFAGARPNAAHHVIAKWQKEGHIAAVMTQNIDGLHTVAGSPTVYELHGSARSVKCIDCQYTADTDPYVREFRETNRVPSCPKCGHPLKHATISFGQSLSPTILQESFALCRRADLFFAVGSSLIVTPAADLPRTAKEHGARLVIINRDPTPLDVIGDIVINESIARTLTQIDAARQDAARQRLA